MIAAVGSAAAIGVGCKSLEQGAREAHAREFSCPENRIDVHPRKDVDAYTSTFGEGVPPSDEVKKDPQRYAIYKKQQRESHENWNGMGEVMEAKGCGHDVLYFAPTRTVRRAARTWRPRPARR